MEEKTLAQRKLEEIEAEPKLMVCANVETILNEAPARLAYLESVLAVKQDELNEAKDELELAKANATVHYEERSRNQEALKMKIHADPAVIEAKKKVRTAKVEVRAAEILHRRAYDEFIAARKLGSMQANEWTAIKGQHVSVKPVLDQQGNKIDPITGEVIEYASR